MAKNHIGITTGNRTSALKNMLFVSCIPITFSHTKYNGVQANPNVMNCQNTCDTLAQSLKHVNFVQGKRPVFKE